MIYEEYDKLKLKFKKAEDDYFSALDKKSILLHGVDPHSINPQKILVQYNNNLFDDKLNEYIAEIGSIDKLITENKYLRDTLEYELSKKEKELRNSNNVYDKIYVLFFIDRRKKGYISEKVGYSYKQTNRKIKEIENNLYPDLKVKREKLRKYVNEKRLKEHEKWQKVFKN